MFKVICINDKYKPNEIPLSRWVKEGEEYTIIKVRKMVQQGRIDGIKLAEINNDDLFPYQYFRLDRFAITEDELDRLINENVLETELINS